MDTLESVLDNIKSRPQSPEIDARYRPSNSTEEYDFMSKFCFRCAKQRTCKIPNEVFCFSVEDDRYPKEWVWKNDNPHCTVYK